MKLMSIQKDAQEIAGSICEMVGVDVVIVDNEMRRVADTFRYPHRHIGIRTQSIIGNVINSGWDQVVENKDYFRECVECKDRAECAMQGLVGVPIRFQDTTAGAIGIVLDQGNSKRLMENVNLILTFLHQMADLLASKLIRQADQDSLQHISAQWNCLMDTVGSGVVLVDEQGRIVTCNEQFHRWFRLDGDDARQPLLSDCLRHPLVQEAMHQKTDVNGRVAVIPLPSGTFRGHLHIRQMWKDGAYCGAVLSCQDVDGLSQNDLLLYNPHSSAETVRRLCGESEAGKRLRELLRDPVRSWEPLLLRGTNRELLLRLAAAFHNSAERTGRFVLIEGRGLYDIPEDRGLFPCQGSDAILLAHRGTICIRDVFELPLCMQQELLEHLRSRTGLNLHTQLILLDQAGSKRNAPIFHDPELEEFLAPRLIELPPPPQTGRRRQAILERSLKRCKARWHKPGLTVEPEAWEALMDLPWKPESYTSDQVMEYLVRTCGESITRSAVLELREQLEPTVQNARDFEKQKILRLINEGLSYTQIAEALQISRSTLYRRLQNYQIRKDLLL